MNPNIEYLETDNILVRVQLTDSIKIGIPSTDRQIKNYYDFYINAGECNKEYLKERCIKQIMNDDNNIHMPFVLFDIDNLIEIVNINGPNSKIIDNIPLYLILTTFQTKYPTF